MGPSKTPQSQREALYSAYLALVRNEDLWHSEHESALRFVVERCAQALGANRASVWRLNDAADEMYCQALYSELQLPVETDLIIKAEDHPQYFEHVNSGRLLVVTDALTHAATATFVKGYLRPLGITSMLDAAVLQGGKITGVLCIEHSGKPREWTISEQNFTSAIADVISQLQVVNALYESQDRYSKVFDATSDAILLMHGNRLVDCNQAALRMFGCTRDEFDRQPATRFWTEMQPCGRPSKTMATEYFARCDRGDSLRFEWMHRRFNGTPFETEVACNSAELNGVPHYIICIRDITDRKAYERHIQKLLSVQNAIFDCAQYSIISTDLNGKILSYNRAAEQMLGYPAKDVINQWSIEAFHEPSELEWKTIELSQQRGRPCSGLEALTASVTAQQTNESEWTYRTQSGTTIPVLLATSALQLDGPKPSGYLFIASDITQRKQAALALAKTQRDIEFRANHDDLTGLPNRARLHHETQDAITLAEQQSQKLALFLIDLDRFKEVNDTLGHAFGDDLIIGIGERLSAYLSPRGARLFRLGGDEFAVLAPSISDMHDVDVLVKGVHRTLRESITIRDIHMEMAGSIGVAMFPDHGNDSHSLLRCADVAMYKAKSKTLNESTMVYKPESDGHSPRRLTMLSELGYAIRNNQLTLHYQPRINIATQECVGCEALVRWQHPKLGMVPPYEFIPLAEMSDQIQPLAYWVLQHALIQARHWLDRGLEMVMSVNLSTRNLMDITIPEQIDHLLKETDVPAKYLEIEITESTLIDDPDRALHVIDRIHALGVRFAIDDFGTGYSSLSYLKRLPISTLKIDRSFIKDMLHDEQDAVIVRSTLGLAHSFGLEVVAEGVEDRETLRVLQALQCEQVQGYYYSKPLPTVDFEDWLGGFKGDAH